MEDSPIFRYYSLQDITVMFEFDLCIQLHVVETNWVVVIILWLVGLLCALVIHDTCKMKTAGLTGIDVSFTRHTELYVCSFRWHL